MKTVSVLKRILFSDPKRGCFIAILLLLFFSVVDFTSVTISTLSWAEVKAFQESDLNLFKKEIKKYSRYIKSSRLTLHEVDEILTKLQDMEGLVDSCIEETSTELQEINALLEKLGPKVKGEALDVTRERYSLILRKKAAEKKNGQCEVLTLKIKPLKNAYERKRKELVRQKLFYRQKDAFTLIAVVTKEAPKWPKKVNTYFTQETRLEIFKKHSRPLLGGLILSLTITAFFFFYFRRLLGRLMAQKELPDPIPRTCLSTLFCGSLLIFLGLNTLGVWLLQGRDLGSSFLASLLLAIFLLLLLYCTSNLVKLLSLLYLKDASKEAYDKINRTIRRWKAFSIFAFFLILIELPPFRQDLAPDIIQFIRLLSFPFAALFLLTSIAPWISKKDAGWIRRVSIWLLYIAVLVIIMVQALGFDNFAKYLVRGTFYTYFSGIIIFGIRKSLHALFMDLAIGQHGWAKTVRKKVGIREGDVLSFFFWLKTITTLFLWTIWGLALFYFWSLSSSYLNRIFSIFFSGFSIGNITIVPVRLITALLAFGVSLALTGWIKRRIDTRLRESYVSKSARDALVTLTGYFGFILALFLGLGIAGFQFSNFTVIAGALSVGIGFGLQNIVNNFVSGLILLFEHPIKRGDWVVVGDTEGYVKKISVRSTIIQTFDRSDVIVPNSDLISNKVTNWMLGDIYGRVKIPVGVAYGSDTKLVKKILLEVAHAHPMVLTDRPDMRPRVYFWEFGDSSLNFRLDVYIKDIDRRRTVRSEINFAIDEAFREHGITIPFPQRDIHIKTE